jgi:disulfide oxidoreductase YuzD
MTRPILVQIIGAPIACADGVKDTWRDVARWAEDQLKRRFGETVQMKYYDLFDADCPAMPDDAQLPVVLVNGETTINGGKISIPAIRRKIESLLEKETA